MSKYRYTDKCNRYDCFAYKDGVCTALKEVDIFCDFYKNVETWKAENEITMRNLKSERMGDKIEYYRATLKELGLISKERKGKRI